MAEEERWKEIKAFICSQGKEERKGSRRLQLRFLLRRKPEKA
jgi:hypothetical protein